MAARLTLWRIVVFIQTWVKNTTGFPGAVYRGTVIMSSHSRTISCISNIGKSFSVFFKPFKSIFQELKKGLLSCPCFITFKGPLIVNGTGEYSRESVGIFWIKLSYTEMH